MFSLVKPNKMIVHVVITHILGSCQWVKMIVLKNKQKRSQLKTKFTTWTIVFCSNSVMNLFIIF